MVGQEVVRQLNVEDPDIFSYLLVPDDTELLHVDRATDLGLALAPLDESHPNEIIGSLANDVAHGVGVATEISLNSFIAQKLNVEVAVATSCFIHIH